MFKIIVLSAQIFINSFHGDMNNVNNVMENAGMAINEAVCKVDVNSVSCVAYCYANLEFVTHDELMPVCKEIAPE